MTDSKVDVKSTISTVMGARISVTGPARCMYLIIGRGTLSESTVKSAGGEVVLRFNGLKMLVTLPFAGYLSLRANRGIAHIGPITVDLKRLAKLAETLAKANNSRPGGAG